MKDWFGEEGGGGEQEGANSYSDQQYNTYVPAVGTHTCHSKHTATTAREPILHIVPPKIIHITAALEHGNNVYRIENNLRAVVILPDFTIMAKKRYVHQPGVFERSNDGIRGIWTFQKMDVYCPYLSLAEFYVDQLL